MAASALDGEITFFSETKGDKITFVAKKRQTIDVGSNPACDIRICEAEDVHMRIQLDATGKVRIWIPTQKKSLQERKKEKVRRHFKFSSFIQVKATNLSNAHPISVNGEVVEDKKTIKSGDVIAIMGHQLRWDTKAELRRRTAALSKSARKEAKYSVIRTAKRLTIHK